MTFQILVERLAARGLKTAENLTARESIVLERLSQAATNGGAKAEATLLKEYSGIVAKLAKDTSRSSGDVHMILVQEMRTSNYFGKGVQASEARKAFESMVSNELTAAEAGSKITAAATPSRAPEAAAGGGSRVPSANNGGTGGGSSRRSPAADLEIGKDRIPQTPKFNVDQTFKEIEDTLKDSDLIQATIDRGTTQKTTGLGRFKKTDVPVKLSPQDILEELVANKPISREEFRRLRTFYKENGFDIKNAAGVAQEAAGGTVIAAGKDPVGNVARLLGMGPKLKEWVSSLANSRMWGQQGTISYNLMHQYENGAKPGILNPTRWTNGYREGSVRAFGASLLALGIGAGFEGWTDPSHAYNFQQGLYNILMPNGGTFGFGAHSNPLVTKETEFVQLMFDRYVSKGGFIPVLDIPFDTLELATKRYVSDKIYKEMSKDNKFEMKPEYIAQIAAELNIRKPRSGENLEGYTAYRLALAYTVGITDPKEAEDWTKIAEYANKRRTESLAQEMTFGEQGSKALIKTINDFVGKDSQVTELSLETAFKVTAEMMQDRSKSGNDFARFGAVIDALSKYYGLEAKEGAAKDPHAKLSQLNEHLLDEWAKSIKSDQKGKSATLFQKVLGTSSLPENPEKLYIDLLEKLKHPDFRTGMEGRLLVAILTPSILGKDETVNAETLNKKQADLNTQLTAKLKAEGERINFEDATRGSSSASSEAAQRGEVKRASGEVRDMFNRMSTDEDFPALQGKGSKLVSIFTEAKDRQTFERQVKEREPSIPPETVRRLAEFAYNR